MIDVSPFEQALGQLELALRYVHNPGEANAEQRQLYRTAAIQAFEYTYELAYRMIRRQLAEIVATPGELNEMAFLDLMRTAADAGLIRAAPPFRDYRDKRNITSHTYNETKAEEVLAVIDPFLQDMRFLLAELKRRNS